MEGSTAADLVLHECARPQVDAYLEDGSSLVCLADVRVRRPVADASSSVCSQQMSC